MEEAFVNALLRSGNAQRAAAFVRALVTDKDKKPEKEERPLD